MLFSGSFVEIGAAQYSVHSFTRIDFKIEKEELKWGFIYRKVNMRANGYAEEQPLINMLHTRPKAKIPEFKDQLLK